MPSARPRWRGADMIHTAKAACRPACPSFLLGLLAHRRRLCTCSSLTLWTDRVSFGRGGRRRGRGAVCAAEVARSRQSCAAAVVRRVLLFCWSFLLGLLVRGSYRDAIRVKPPKPINKRRFVKKRSRKHAEINAESESRDPKAT